jgi:alkylation response protein AidB-like acyl-CoA dehydrogenase
LSYIVNRRDLDFLMWEMLDFQELLSQPRYLSYDRATVTAVLDAAQAIAEEKFLPCAAMLDANEPVMRDGKVAMPKEVGDALTAYADAGLFGAAFDEALGGSQMPHLVNLAVNGMFTCANLGIANYAFLTIANANMLNDFGSDEQKRLYLPPMLEGRWFGTMCLSEPEAGSSLSDIRTRAEPLGDGHYRLVGSKMWISGGDQEISENIVHMVLAKIPGGPAGVKGISLFLVPKYRVNDDGSIGAWNNVALAGLNHKMGHRGTTNCLLNLGEGGDCLGTLVGEPHAGLKHMFHMMNEARLLVGHGSVMSGQAGFLYSLDYARSRVQGRQPGNKDPLSPQVPIIEHADIKRMLMAQKVAVEGGLALCAYCALLVDIETTAANPDEREKAHLLLELLTPIAKSWPSEHCLEANKLAIQVLGGYGYSREYPVERFYRDNRLNHIHEGTFAVHGLDLLGRKVGMQGGEALAELVSRIEQTLKSAHAHGGFDFETAALRVALDAVLDATRTALECPRPDLALANATLYLDAFGQTVIAWIWLWQALVADAAPNSHADAFYAGKLAACRYFFRYELPHVHAQLSVVRSLDETCLALRAEQFLGF